MRRLLFEDDRINNRESTKEDESTSFFKNSGVTENKWSLNSSAYDHMCNNAVGAGDVLIKAFNRESWIPGI